MSFARATVDSTQPSGSTMINFLYLVLAALGQLLLGYFVAEWRDW